MDPCGTPQPTVLIEEFELLIHTNYFHVLGQLKAMWQNFVMSPPYRSHVYIIYLMILPKCRALLHKTMVTLQLMVSLQTMVTTIDFLILVGYGAVLLW